MSTILSPSRKTIIAIVLALILSGAATTAALRFTSAKYLYSISLPDGWIQIPDAELVSFKKNLPPQAQHLIYDAAFQRGNAGKWFDWPYIMVQVSPPPTGVKNRRLPTETEFEKFISISAMSSGKAVVKLKEAIDAVPDPQDRSFLNSLLPALSKPAVQVSTTNRKYWFVIDENDPISGPMKMYSAGTFMPDGNIIIVHAYTSANSFEEDIGQFLLISGSLRKSGY